jgi:hypothetical protein
MPSLPPASAATLPPGFTLDQTATPGTAEAIGRGMASGATLNFYDEMAGLSAASGERGKDDPMSAWQLLKGGFKLLTGDDEAGQRYEAEAAKQRQAEAAATAAHPIAHFAGEAAGMVPTFLAGGAVAPAFKAIPGIGPGLAATLTGQAAPGAGLLARGGALAASGAGYGALAGAGAADEGNRLQGAVQGGLTGAALAPALGLGGSYLAGHARATLAPFLPRGATPTADQAILRALRSGSPAQAQSGTPIPVQDLIDPIVTQLRQAQAAGQPLTMADIGGSDLQARIGSLVRQAGPGRAPARQFLNTRQIGDQPLPGDIGPVRPGQGARIDRALGDLAGSNAGSQATAEQIAARQEADAAQWYGRARATPIPDSSIPVHLLPRLRSEGILQKAIQRARTRGRPFDIGNVDAWDRMKRVLSDRISTALRKGANTEAADFTELRNDLTGAIDRAVPTYRRARQIFAGHAELNDALEAGRQAFQSGTSREAVATAYSRLTPSEQEMFRLSYINAQRESLARQGPGINKAREAYGTPSATQKIETIAPSQVAERRFAERMAREQQMFETRQGAMGGSQTAERVADDAESGKQALELMHFTHALGSGHIWQAAKIAARHLAKVDPTERGHVLNAIREIALDPNPATVEAFARRIQGANLPSGVRTSVVGAVRNALNRLPRTLSTQAAGGTQQ